MDANPPVTHIRLEYADGSFDKITLLQRGGCPLFKLERKRQNSEISNQGAYSAGAIAGMLFQTAATTERADKPFDNPKIIAVMRHWFNHPSTGG
jgi:hypothetical protein